MGASCPFCGAELTSHETAVCTSCGKSFTIVTEGSAVLSQGQDFIGRYFSDLSTLLTRPTRFFIRLRESERSRPGEGIAGALTFAIVTHWIGQAIKFFWQAALGGAIADRFMPAFKLLGDLAEVDHPGQSEAFSQTRDRLIHWMWGAGSVIADPFITLAQILFTSFLVFVGARILVSPGRSGAPTEIRYDTALKIVCYGLSPAILAGLPFAGPVVGAIGAWIVTTIGAREVYRIGWGRAVVVALFPKLLFVGVLGFGMLLIGILFFKLLASVL